MHRLAATLLTLAPGLTLAQEAAEHAEALSATDPLGGGGMLQLTLSLAAVLVAVFVVGWVLRRVQGVSGGSSGALKVVSVLPLGTRERIVLVQAGDTQLLVGLAPGRVQALHVLEEPVAVPAESASVKTPSALFRQLMKSGGAT